MGGKRRTKSVVQEDGTVHISFDHDEEEEEEDPEVSDNEWDD